MNRWQKMNWLLMGLMGIVCIALTGCQAAIIETMVRAPNFGKELKDAKPTPNSWLSFWGIDEEFRVEVGPPTASVRIWQIDPDAECMPPGGPKGTVLVLHGYRASSMWLRGMGKGFADAGYRVLMIDSRGHGRSTGDYITFGVQESADLVQVVDTLHEQQRVIGKLGVWGISMGAATAIQHAAHDSRVQAVVAVAPYSTFREAAPHMIRRTLPGYGLVKEEEDLQQIVDLAGKKAGFDPDEASAAEAIKHVKSPVLLLHGSSDFVVPASQSEAIHEAAPQITQLSKLPLRGHITIHFSKEVEKRSVRWFDQHLIGLPLPDDPPGN